MLSLSKLTAVSALTAAVAASAASAVAFNCHGINYNIRAGPDWADASTKCKPAEQIATELATLKQFTDRIRLYSLTDCDQATAVVPAAISAGLQIELGLWVDSYPENYAAEKAAFETLLATGVVTSDNIAGIHVGSEAIYRGDVDFDTAVSYLEEIRTLCKADANAADIPLTITDVGNTYRAYPDLVDAVDFVSANLFPFWDSVEIDSAGSYFLGTYERLVNIAAEYEGNKTVVIGETGWPYNGTDASGSATSTANAAQYFSDFYQLANEHGIEYYYFSSFDESWKAEQYGDDSVEPYFGLWTADGVLHAEIAALTLDDESVDDTSDLLETSTSGSGLEESVEVDAGSLSVDETVTIDTSSVEASSASVDVDISEATVGVEESLDVDVDADSEDDDVDEDFASAAEDDSALAAEDATEATATDESDAATATASAAAETVVSTKGKDCPM
jgi:glucan 1,3-beta-glucosidase